MKVFTKQHGRTFARRCKHFDGIDFTNHEKRCAAGCLMAEAIKGVEYRYRYGNERTVYTSAHSMPCFTDGDPLGVCHCDKQEFPTPEEVEANRRETHAVLNRAMIARKAIVEHLGGPWKRGTPSAGGVIDCPVCHAEKSLRFSRAGVNGHIHAACKTEGCVSWME